ncbi:BPSS1780 family membrane protein [Parazoarcus communis]|nr:BPSS1780 family membrane protein [Parazoarcus communis]
MQANQLPMQRGWGWLRDGLTLWLRSPALLSFLAFGYLLVLLVISIFPLIGQPAASLLMPILSLGVLNGYRAVAAGRKVGPDVLFSGFKSNVQSLVTIGGIYLIASVLVLALTALADGGGLFAVMTGGNVDDAAITDSSLPLAMLLAVALSTPVVMAYWFAPVLAGWWNITAPKAMFFSFHACLRNWRPFLAYAIGLMIFGAFIPGIVIGVIGLLSPTLATILTVPLPLILIPVVFASFFTSARDVFGLPDEVIIDK